MLLSSIIYSFSATILRFFGDVPTSTKINVFNIWSIILGALAIIIREELSFDVYSINNLLSLSLIVITTYSYSSLEVRAYSLTTMAKLAPFTFTNIIWSILFDIFIF